jgi:hypothetical protein
MIDKGYYRKGSAEKKIKKILWSWGSRAWSQHELIGGKPPIVK